MSVNATETYNQNVYWQTFDMWAMFDKQHSKKLDDNWEQRFVNIAVLAVILKT